MDMSDVRRKPITVEIFDLDEFDVDVLKDTLDVIEGKIETYSLEEARKIIRSKDVQEKLKSVKEKAKACKRASYA